MCARVYGPIHILIESESEQKKDRLLTTDDSIS